MLPKTSRLPYRDFRLRGFYSTRTPFFILKIKKGSGVGNRIGVIISSAVVKSAVRRNFWKRQVQSNFKLLPATGNDFLIIFSGNIKNATAKTFKETFFRAAMTAR